MACIRIYASVLSLIIYTVSALAEVKFTYTVPGGEEVIAVEAPASAGLNGGVHVAPSTAGLRMVYTSDNPSQVKWSRYSSLGAAYAEAVTSSGNDTGASWLDSPQGDMGYVIEDGASTTYLWLVDYSGHAFSPGNITLSAEQECGRTALDCSGKGDEIAYYSITGRRLTLSRDISLSYSTLVWDESAQNFNETPAEEILEYISPVIHVDAPLCQTSFTLEGDRFTRQWGRPLSCESASFPPHSIAAHTSAMSDNTPSDNETSAGQTGGLGGSAPCTVNFVANVTDAAIFHEWQMSRFSDFDDVSLRASELDFTHTFTEQGTTYVRLYCANDDASCECYSETYEIAIGESLLKCPNAFTPFNQDGVNDVWKVTYSSIIEFECHIFNRSGRKMASFTDPSQGWDGRYNGKFVPAGAYYYVIKARGADGKDYKLSGDINILEYK